MAVLTESLLIVIALAVAFPAGLDIAAEFVLDVRSPILGVLAALPMLAFFALAMHTRWKPLRRIRELLFTLLGYALAQCTTWELFCTGMLAGLAEELLFRGVLQPLVVRWAGVPAAVALVALIFGLLHAVTPTYAVVATLIGVYLGWLAEACSRGGVPNLVPPVVAHGFYDFVAFVIVAREYAARAQTATMSTGPDPPHATAAQSDGPRD